MAMICSITIKFLPTRVLVGMPWKSVLLISQISFTSLQPFPLLTIPLFVLSGRLMETGGMADRLIDVARKMVGSYRGSTGMMTVLACMLFSALTGSGSGIGGRIFYDDAFASLRMDLIFEAEESIFSRLLSNVNIV